MTFGVCVKHRRRFIWIFTGITRKLTNLVTKALEAGRNISADEPAHPEVKLAQAHSPCCPTIFYVPGSQVTYQEKTRRTRHLPMTSVIGMCLVRFCFFRYLRLLPHIL